MGNANEMPAWAAMEMINMLVSRVANLEARMSASAEEDENDPYPPVGGSGSDSWKGIIYVQGITYSGLTDASKPYVRVAITGPFAGTVLVEETDEEFPNPMPPNEEWFKKSECKDPPHITRFG